MSKKTVVRYLSALLALVLVASACGGRDDDTTEAGTTTSAPPTTEATDATGDPTTEETLPPEPDVCDVELEATEIGVTEDTIKVIVMADDDNPLAPALFAAAREGAFAWADHVNANGGVACRDIEIEFADAKLTREGTVNGFLQACGEALALVGTTVLLGQDTSDLNSCPDQAGNEIGVPDLAYITTEVAHQCSAVSFHVSRPGASCPFESGERDYRAQSGPVQWLAENAEAPLHGIFLIPGDFQTTRDSAVPIILSHEEAGVTYDGRFGVSGAAPLSAFTPFVQRMRDEGSNWIYNGSNDATMINMLEEARNQGLDLSDATVVCSISCYTPAFLDQGDLVEGVYVWFSFTPFEERDVDEELDAFLTAMDDPFPAAWAAGAWAGGRLFEVAVNQIVERDGPNAITRQALLDELATIDNFDSNGWWSPSDFTTSLTISHCYVLLQIQDGEFVRVNPSERGELTCEAENVVAVTADPTEFETDT